MQERRLPGAGQSTPQPGVLGGVLLRIVPAVDEGPLRQPAPRHSGAVEEVAEVGVDAATRGTRGRSESNNRKWNESKLVIMLGRRGGAVGGLKEKWGTGVGWGGGGNGRG